jgi:hypothetical protein
MPGDIINPPGLQKKINQTNDKVLLIQTGIFAIVIAHFYNFLQRAGQYTFAKKYRK